jgi:hypothetical protein
MPPMAREAMNETIPPAFPHPGAATTLWKAKVALIWQHEPKDIHLAVRSSFLTCCCYTV